MEHWSEPYSVLRAVEGGISQKDVHAFAKKTVGVHVRFGSSPYIGHYSVRFKTRDKRKLDRLERYLYGK